MKKLKVLIVILAFIFSFTLINSVKAASYQVGDEITVKGEKYYIISVPTGKEYVVALKANPLTIDEINSNGGQSTTKYESIGYGAVPFYANSTSCTQETTTGCETNYINSNIKSVVEAWTLSTFDSDELATDNGYKARLITVSELTNLGFTSKPSDEILHNGDTENIYYDGSSTFDWVYNSAYQYWTMDRYLETSKVVAVWDGKPSEESSEYNSYALAQDTYSDYGVRPVVNVKKSAFETTNTSDTVSSDTGNSKSSDSVKVEDTLLQKSLVVSIIGLLLIAVGISIYLINLKRASKK